MRMVEVVNELNQEELEKEEVMDLKNSLVRLGKYLSENPSPKMRAVWGVKNKIFLSAVSDIVKQDALEVFEAILKKHKLSSKFQQFEHKMGISLELELLYF